MLIYSLMHVRRLIFPQYLLSSHFWSEAQRKEFDERQSKDRIEHTKLLGDYLLKNQNEKSSKIITECLDKIKQEKVGLD